jgi:UDP-glucose:(glucosyl)LPS alpha-1,2-glucosyltransferase
MSCVYKGKVIDTDLSQNSKGGTEMMRDRLVRNADPDLLKEYAIHLSRPREIYDDVKNIFYCHDLAMDPENKILKDEGWKKFDHFVFVSYWQRDQYILLYGIPYSKCTVIQNSIELEYTPIEKQTDAIRLIYHTTPHRGLELVYPIVDALSKEFDNIHLDVYSSFSVYGWDQRDKPFEDLFNKIKDHDHMTYHGAVSNEEVLDALRESHIFLFPSIWQETSCIAMIEAIRSGALVVHPSYGALQETAGDATIMYEYTEVANDHASMAFSVVKNLLSAQKLQPQLFNNMTTSERFVLPRNGINNFTNSWNNLLKVLRNG